MAFFTTAITTLKTLVCAIGAGLAAWGVINLLEGYAPGRNGQFININELQEELSENSDTEDSYQPII